MIHVYQRGLITAILRELDAQEPGARITQAQMDAIIRAADWIVLAMKSPNAAQTQFLNDLGPAMAATDDIDPAYW